MNHTTRKAPVVHESVRLDLVDDVRRAIVARSSSPSTASLNVGGWKSGEDFFAWPDPAVRELHDTLREVVGGSPIVGWAMVNRAGSSHPRHTHEGASVSGIYYVDPGEVRWTTPTVFELAGGGEVYVDPLAGRLVVFPSSTWHRVPKYHGTADRITVAFDARRLLR